MFSEWIRRTVFWTLDFLRGSQVRSHYSDIKNIMNENTTKKSSEIRENYLSNMMEYASENTSFYESYKGCSSIENFPIINKGIIKKDYQNFQSKEFLNKEVVDLHTSGSTGTPFVVRQDRSKRNRVFAEMMYFWDKAGYKIGMKYVFFRVWTDVNRKSKLNSWARNIVMHDILHLDKENLEMVRKRLKSDKKIKMLISYASTFDNLATYLHEAGDTPKDFSVTTILSSSEVLQESTRKKLIEVFGCNVVSLYSNQENGTLAQECPENKEFHLNNASYYFEFLKLDADVPAEINEPARIVVTDLFNKAMPLIRYDTGDLATLKDRCDCKWPTQALSSIQGRIIDCIYDTRGGVISPHTVTNYMWPFDKIQQFQLIQEDERKYLLKLNGARPHYEDKQFIKLFTELFGGDAQILIEHVNEIPVLKSGKRKKVVCNYTP